MEKKKFSIFTQRRIYFYSKRSLFDELEGFPIIPFHLKPICSIWPKKGRATVSHINKFAIYGDKKD